MDNNTWEIVKSVITVIVYIAGIIVGCMIAPKIFGW